MGKKGSGRLCPTYIDVKKQAIAKHRAGQREEAETLYRRCLEQSPDDADVLYYLGLLCHETGRSQEAVGYLQQVLSDRPELAEAHGLLAATGHFRLMNLALPPFSFCKPILRIGDWIEGTPARHLALWEKKDLVGFVPPILT